MKKYEIYEQKKRDLLLDRLAHVFQTNRSFVENLLSINFRKSLRVNTIKVTDEEKLINEITNSGVILSKIPWCEHAYFIDQDEHNLSYSSFFNDGLIYLQNASSLLPPLLLEPSQTDSVLDMCAAPGGKATHIAALTNNNGQLWVNDSSYLRIQKMAEILYRYGVRTKEVLIKRAEELELPNNMQFDKILLDAQCSGEGMINLTQPRALRYWSEIRIRKFQSLQKRMIESAYNLLKPGGTLVYSTCTFAPEENELIIDLFLKHHKDMRIAESNIQIPTQMPGLKKWEKRSLNPNLAKALRVIPNLYMEGFFVCKLEKEKTF